MTETGVQRPRSRLGIAAFVLALVAIIAPLVLGIIATASGLSSGSLGSDASASGWAVLAGVVFIGIGAACATPIAITAMVLAIVSLTRRNRRRGFAVAGLILSIGPAIVGAALIPVTLQELFS